MSKLFFSNFNFTAEEVDIYDLFNQHGKTIDIEILRDKFNRSLGAGYVEFEDPSCNQKAINALNGKLYKDSIIHVEIAQKQSGKDSIRPANLWRISPSIPDVLSLPRPPLPIDQPSTDLKNPAPTNKDSDSEYDYYNSDLYYYNSDSEDDHHAKDPGQNVFPKSPYALNTPPPLQPIRLPQSLLPLPPAAPPLVSDSSSGMMNNYVSPRKSVMPPPPVILNQPHIENHVSPFRIPKEDDFPYDVQMQHIHEHRHHRRGVHARLSSRSLPYPDEMIMVPPPRKDSPYWKSKRSQVIEKLKNAAYIEMDKILNEKKNDHIKNFFWASKKKKKKKKK